MVVLSNPEPVNELLCVVFARLPGRAFFYLFIWVRW